MLTGSGCISDLSSSVVMVLQHVTLRVPSTLSQELYVFGAAGLQQQFLVRPCVAKTDMLGVEQLVYSLSLGDVLLADVRQYLNASRDDVSKSVCHFFPVLELFKDS